MCVWPGGNEGEPGFLCFLRKLYTGSSVFDSVIVSEEILTDPLI